MIIESLGGEPLAERIGETSGWRQFALYRAATSSGNMTVTFALTGLGEVCIDDVSVRIVRRGTPLPGPNFGGTDVPAAQACAFAATVRPTAFAIDTSTSERSALCFADPASALAGFRGRRLVRRGDS